MIIDRVKGWFGLLLGNRAQEVFKVKPLSNQEMDAFVERCLNIYQGKPFWADDDIKTVNFARAVCSEVARLTTLAIGVTVDGSTRAEYLQKQIDNCYFQLRQWVEYGCAAGTVILKPNGESIECFMPDRFVITDEKNGKINGAVFYDSRWSATEKKWYTRLEYHRFEDGVYKISNTCYKGENENDTGTKVDIESTPWNELEAEVEANDVEKPLFAVFRCPAANNIDTHSAMGLPVFADALQELRDLDVAYSRNAEEIESSQRIVMIDSDRLLAGKTRMPNSLEGYQAFADKLKLPKFIKAVSGTGSDDIYHEINPAMSTPVRLEGINSLLSQIGYKCGFANGYFAFNSKTGFATATQIEADQQRTIQTIKDFRDQLENCMDALLYALDRFADDDGAPMGEYEAKYDFGDITYNEEEDRQRWIQYASMGIVPKWKLLEKFEGFSEEEAKALADQTTDEAIAQNRLFGEEV